MKGNLKDFHPTQILNLVSLAKKSGTLYVNHKGTKGALAFREGKLVFAALGGADGSLANVLVRAKRISKEQGETLSKHAEKTSDKQLGLLLIQKNYVSRADIIKSIKRHALTIINEFAHWKEGAFEFNGKELPGNDRILVPLDLENIIIQIARVQKRDEQLMDEIPSLDVGLKFTTNSKHVIKDLELNRDEWSVLRYVKGGNTIRMIAKSLDMGERQIRRVIGSLREAGLIELVQIREKQELSPEEVTEKKKLVGRLISHFQNMGN